MAIDLSNTLVVGVSSRALFDLEHENKIFEADGLDAYSQYQLKYEEDVLSKGTVFPLISALLAINDKAEKKLVEVVLMSRNNADCSIRIYKSIEHYKLDIVRGAFTSGRRLAPYLEAFSVDLYLSASEDDVRAAAEAGHPAGLIKGRPENLDSRIDQVRVAFDGDAVLFSDHSERIYKEQGLEAFLEHERVNARKPLPEGPLGPFFRMLSLVQKAFKPEDSPIRTALVTARNSPAHERVIRTLREWDARIDETFFMGGVSKANVLGAFGAHIFFDDQTVHTEPASKLVPTALVFPGSADDGTDDFKIIDSIPVSMIKKQVGSETLTKRLSQAIEGDSNK